LTDRRTDEILVSIPRLQSINQSSKQSLFANAITSKQQKKCGRLLKQAIAQQSYCWAIVFMQRGKNQQQALSLLLRNYAELHLHKMTWYLAEEYHQKYTSDTSCSKNDKECSP